jgi:hypothetical protein
MELVLSREFTMADTATVRVLKFDAGSTTDQALLRMQSRLSASSSIEAMRRSLTIADKITEFTANGQKVFVQDPDGSLKEIVIS